ncbi:MAG TPA: DUF2723 domain-containing protein [Bacteroidota bacterium]
MQSIVSSPVRVGLLLSAVVFVVYSMTLAPSVGFIDSGELSAVACTLGIAHPTGYPLFTLLGWVFSRLPIGSEEVIRLNMMASFFCAAGIFLFFLTTRFILELIFKKESGKDQQFAELLLTFASAGASLLLAFSETYWSQSTNVEVYSLHVFLVCAILYFFVRAAWQDKSAETDRWWYAFAFVVGLSFTNHMTTILLALGLLYLYFATQGSSPRSWKRLLFMSIPFLFGLTVYLYLPFRASQSPDLNWGNPSTLETFLWHLSGKQYRVWIFSSTEAASRQLKYFVGTLPSQFTYLGLVLSMLGFVALGRRSLRLFVTILTLFITCVLYSINYDIHDIDSYFLLAYICMGLWISVGLLRVGQWLAQRLPSRRLVLSSLIVVGCVPAIVHFDHLDESSNYLVEDYTHNMFASVDSNALVLSFQWDYWVSASYYYQLVRGQWTDITVIDKELLRRSWYLTELENRYPALMNSSNAEVTAFRNELFKFEHDVPYDPAIIQARFIEMIRSFIGRSISRRPVYVTSEIEPEITAGWQRVPSGLAFRLYADTLFHRTEAPLYRYRKFEREGRLEDMIRRLYSVSLTARGAYYYYRGGERGEILRSIERSLEFDPTNREALALTQRLQR